jgi:hypothetical protein
MLTRGDTEALGRRVPSGTRDIARFERRLKSERGSTVGAK